MASALLTGMVLAWGTGGLLVLGVESYRRFATARAGGRTGAAPYLTYFVCCTVGLWVIGTVAYFAATG